MRYILSAEQMKESDRRTIEEIGIPSAVLMERAALACIDVLEEEKIDCSKALIVCGAGNNGGDGFAIARLLHGKGYSVCVVFAGKEGSGSADMKQQMDILKNYGVSIGNWIKPGEYSVVIDAVFGIGLSRPLEGDSSLLIRQMNDLPGKKIAIDIPSGVDGTDGRVLGEAFQADLTIAFACEKLGCLLFPGSSFAGNVVVRDIGIDLRMYEEDLDVCYTYEWSDIPALLPQRRSDSHKGNYGRLLMIAGSPGMAGAAYLSAKAAYKTGVGLVQIYTPQENVSILQTLLPEAVIHSYRLFDESELLALMERSDVISIGSGMGQSEVAAQILRCVAKFTQKPCVADADALNLLSGEMELLVNNGHHFILTPHMKEMSRLIGKTVAQIKDQRLQIMKDFTEQTKTVCVLKDSRTAVCALNQPIYLNRSGCAAMAKAGAGDVLAGMIAGLLSQGLPPFQSAALGVYLHGLSGEKACAKQGIYSVLADDLTESIGEAMRNKREDR